MIVISSVAASTSGSLWLTSHRPLLLLDHPPQRGEQEVRLRRREERRGLIEHQDLRVPPQALDDLHPLAHAGW